MKVDSWFTTNKSSILEQYFAYLRFPSIGAQSAHSKDLLACADWVENYLQKMGLKSQRLCGAPYPVLLATRVVDPSYPTVLFYGHYDVQPIDPIDAWRSDPFEPVERNGRVYARGAQDNKGQSFYVMQGIRAFLEGHPQAPINIKFLLEGEEETGSATLIARMPEWAEALKSDYTLLVDGGMGSIAQPGITIGVRGIVSFELECRCAKMDLHSGEFGGIAENPLMVLSQLLGSVYNKEGRIAIPNFYDSVRSLSLEEKSHLDLEEHTEEYEGIQTFRKQKGVSLKEANSLLPTFEINGMWGGYTQPGFKTVIPATAHAKISCRLVPDQDPEAVFQKVSHYLRSNVGEHVVLNIQQLGGAESYWASPTSLLAEHLRDTYESILGKPTKCLFSGGTIGLTSELAKHSGGQVVLPGFGLAVDQIHAPNESFSIEQFQWGVRMVFDILHKLQYSDAT